MRMQPAPIDLTYEGYRHQLTRTKKRPGSLSPPPTIRAISWMNDPERAGRDLATMIADMYQNSTDLVKATVLKEAQGVYHAQLVPSETDPSYQGRYLRVVSSEGPRVQRHIRGTAYADFAERTGKSSTVTSTITLITPGTAVPPGMKRSVFRISGHRDNYAIDWRQTNADIAELLLLLKRKHPTFSSTLR